MLDLERSLQTLKAAACVLNLGANITERVRALRWSFFNPPQPQTRRALVSQEPCLEGDRLPRPGTRKEPRPGGPPDSSSPRTPPGCPGGEGARGGEHSHWLAWPLASPWRRPERGGCRLGEKHRQGTGRGRCHPPLASAEDPDAIPACTAPQEQALGGGSAAAVR